MASSKKTTGFCTRAIHAGQEPDPATGAVVLPIHLSTTFRQSSPGVHKGFEYSRAGNPTRQALETNVAALEGGHGCGAFASGMAAIGALVQLHDSGTHFLVGENVYGGTFRIFERIFRRQGYQVSWVDTRDLKAVSKALRKNTRLALVETPTNPMMYITDLAALATLVHRAGARLAVDNTFLSPWFQRPIEHGADFVVHSATKYLGGHSDLVGGLLITTTAADTEEVHFLQRAAGSVLSPFDSWLLLRGIKTLSVRMDAQQTRAHAVARFLEGHRRVSRVIYPGLESHPQYELARLQATGAGALLSFELVDGADPVRFLRRLKVATLAESLGAVETLVCQPGTMTHASVPLEQREQLGISDRLMRISVGLEDAGDLIADLTQALKDV